MNEQMQMIIILFIFAFLAGFFIIYFLRKNAHKKKYEEKISTLEEKYKKAAHLYTKTLEKEKRIQSAFHDVHKHYKTKKEYLNSLASQEADLLQQISSFENKKEELGEKIKSADKKIIEINDEIAHLSLELKDLNVLRDIIQNNEEKISHLESLLTDKIELKEAYHNDIDKLKNARKSLRLETEVLQEKITGLKSKLSEKTQMLQKIEKKYSGTIQTLTEEVTDLKIRALNYEYALKEYTSLPDNKATKITNKFIQKMFLMPNTKTKEIDSIVRKNDHIRWIDKLAGKLFKKQYPVDEEI